MEGSAAASEGEARGRGTQRRPAWRNTGQALLGFYSSQRVVRVVEYGMRKRSIAVVLDDGNRLAARGLGKVDLRTIFQGAGVNRQIGAIAVSRPDEILFFRGRFACHIGLIPHSTQVDRVRGDWFVESVRVNACEEASRLAQGRQHTWGTCQEFAYEAFRL